MIVLQASVAADEMTKPVFCPKCERGKLGNIPEKNEAVISKRGKPPPDRRGECFQVKCTKCGSLWSLTIE